MTEFEVVSGRKDGVDLVLICRREVIFRSAIWIRKKFILHQNKIYWTRVTEIGIFTETSNGEHNAFTKLKRNCIILLIESVPFIGKKNVVVTEDCDCELMIAPGILENIEVQYQRTLFITPINLKGVRSGNKLIQVLSKKQLALLKIKLR